MVEVFDNIYVGDDEAYEKYSRDYNFSYVHCAKYPYHKNVVGYDAKLSEIHPEYLFAHRNGVLALNMVDARESKYFNPVQFQYAVLFISGEIKKGNKVLINCNKGYSRSPSVALVYLAKLGVVRNDSYAVAKEDFEKLYPPYKPTFGVASFLVHRWKALMSSVDFIPKSVL